MGLSRPGAAMPLNEGHSSSKNSANSLPIGACERLMKDPKQEAASAGPARVAGGAAKTAEKVQSSRYEWERRSEDPETPRPTPKAARGSLLAALGARLKKMFSLDFFDKDDDATPSAA